MMIHNIIISRRDEKLETEDVTDSTQTTMRQASIQIDNS